MTKEEAVAVFECLATEMTAILAGIPKNKSEAKQIQRYIDAFDMAISALRQQEHFREVTKKAGPLTNAQKIRAMTDEELVNFLMRLMGHAQCFAEGIFPYHPCPQNHNCKQCGIDWLQQQAGEEDKHETD